MVLVDKDLKEIAAVEEVFISAVIFLCLFHVLRAVDRRLNLANLRYDRQNEIYEMFRDAVYSETEEELELIACELCAIGMCVTFALLLCVFLCHL